MLKPAPPMSNAERQRQFRERNPGYYGRLHRKRKAEVMALIAARTAAAEAMAARPAPLMLPAPVEDPAMAALDALAASLKSGSSREPLPVATPAAAPRPANQSRAA
jgi:hypothetical protein